MAPTTPNSAQEASRRPLQAYNSFPRIDPATPGIESTPRSRSSTLDGASPNIRPEITSNCIENTKPQSEPDVFDSATGGERNSRDDKKEGNETSLPSDFHELPLELISLTDTFIDSLSAKIHPTPPTVDKLSLLFQDFYVLAATHINTHISILSSRQHRQNPPSPSTSSISSTASRIRAKATSIGNKDRPKVLLLERKDTDQQLLTAEEISERKKARKVLEQKRVALEEAVERRVTEKIYDRIWRHRSTQDEAQDEKLRSKTAALAVVGIGLTDLGIDLGEETTESAISDKETEVKEWLEGARHELFLMNSEKSPLGKLQRLKAAHKCIVETLSHFHPSSSADEIMPMLIYTLITSPPEGINVISNLYYIQRFRSESKIDGEAAYCLTNLEAAITFLETVDLTLLRADESLSGPPKSTSRPSTPRFESPSLLSVGTPAQGISTPSLSPAVISPPSADSKSGRKPELSPSLRPGPTNRRLSELFQPAQALSAAAQDAADQGIKTIGSSLGESYNFLLGKLKERQETKAETIVPKTLDDARKLVGTPPPADEDGSVSGASLLHVPDANEGVKSEAKGEGKLVSMISGRGPRDRSADSARSSGSAGKKVVFAGAGEKDPKGAGSPLGGAPALQVAEGIRLLSNTFSPMSKFAGGIGMMRGFGRATPAVETAKEVEVVDGGVAELTTAFPDLAPVLPPKEARRVEPPIQRFMEVKNPGDLRLGEVVELLRDYRRLAGVLKELGAV